MESRYANYRFLSIIFLLCVILTSFSALTVASAQEQPSIRFLNADNETITYEYNLSTQLSVPIANLSKAAVIIEVTLWDMDFRNVTGQVLSETEVFTLPNQQSLDPGRTTTLEFNPKPDIKLQSGTYEGFIGVRNINTSELIFKNLKVIVANVSYSIISIDSATPIKIDYKSLLKDKQTTIAVAVQNNSNSAIKIDGKIVIQGIFDNNDQSISPVTNSIDISPGQIQFLYFELTDALIKNNDVSPKKGKYNGYIVISMHEDNSSKSVPVVLEVPAKDKSWVQYHIIDWFKAIGRWLWKYWGILITLCILLICFILRKWRIWRASHRPGPVTIEKVENATGEDKLKENGLATLMRDGLADINLLPDSQSKPFDTIAESIAPVAASVPTAQGLPLQALIKLLPKLICPATGHKIVSTLRKRNDSLYELVFEITDVRTGQISKIDIVQGETPEDAVKQAVYEIYHNVIMDHPRVCRNIVPWSRFSTVNSIMLYQQGKRLENTAPKEALKKYLQAADEEPNNVAIKQRIISISQNNPTKQLDSHLRTVEQWPQLLELRYRLATHLSSYAEELDREWKCNEVDKNHLKILLDHAIGYTYSEEDMSCKVFGISLEKEDIDELRTCFGLSINRQDPNKKDAGKEDPKMGFLKLAYYQWEYLVPQTDGKNIGPLLMALWPPFNQSGEKSYMRWWYCPWRKESRNLHRAIKLAKYCNDLYSKKYTDTELLKHDIEKIVKPKYKSSISWEVHYNAACCYAIAISEINSSKSSADLTKENLARTAVEHLKQVIRDPEFAGMNWLFDGDPDLNNLRMHSVYKYWLSLIKPEEKPILAELSEEDKEAIGNSE